MDMQESQFPYNIQYRLNILRENIKPRCPQFDFIEIIALLQLSS